MIINNRLRELRATKKQNMLTGKNIILQTIRKENLSAMHDLMNDATEKGDFCNQRLWSMPDLEKKFNDNYFWNDDNGLMLLIDRKDYRLLGTIGFFKESTYVEGYEISYQLYKKIDRGKGIMPEALKLIVSYLFQVKPIPRLQIKTDVKNIQSQRVAEKCGFKYEGTLRSAVFHKGWSDLKLFSLIREEAEIIEFNVSAE